MIATKTVELELPIKANTNQQNHLQRSAIRQLVMDKEITMADALPLLSVDDQHWLVNGILQTAQENLFVACHISDELWAREYWKRYNIALGHLFSWFHKDSDLSYHGQVLAMLRALIRRYSPQELAHEQIELIQRLTLRLHEKELGENDVLASMIRIEESGLSTLLDLSPVADQLFASYVDELRRS